MTHPEVPTEPPASGEVIAEGVELRWPDDVGTDAQPVNQVLLAWDQNITDALYMYLGHFAPPPWIGVELAQSKMAELGYKVPITPRGSFVMSRARAEELWTVLGRHLGKLPK